MKFLRKVKNKIADAFAALLRGIGRLLENVVDFVVAIIFFWE